MMAIRSESDGYPGHHHKFLELPAESVGSRSDLLTSQAAVKRMTTIYFPRYAHHQDCACFCRIFDCEFMG